jgi:hypothetical protein
MLPEFNGNETGYGMSDEELGTMNDLWLEINKVEEKWEAIKENIGAGFGKVSLDLLVNVEGTLDGIADYLNAKDDAGKQAALDKIRKNVEDFFTKLADVIRECIGILADVGKELQGSDDPVVSTIGGILTTLADSLQWIVDNQQAVKVAFEAIFGVWLIAKLAAVKGQLSGIIMQIRAIMAFKALGGAGGAVTGAEAAEAASEAGKAGATAAGGAGSVLAGALGMYGIYKSFEWAMDRRKNHREEVLGTDENLKESTGGNEEMIATFSRWAGLQNKMENSEFDMTEAEMEATNTEARNLWEKLEGMEGFGKFWDSYQAWRTERNMNASDFSMPEWLDASEALEDKLEEVIEDADLSEKEYTDEDRDLAVQDWFDAWKDWITGNIDDDEYQSAWDYFDEVFGEKQGDVMDAILQKLNEQEDQTKLENIPEDWWRTTGNWGKTENEDGVTSTDMQGFRALPGNIQTAVQRGAAAGVSGIKVNLDGRTVGELVAPYVSLEIAKSMI